jgi:hypothetical protein
MTVRSKGPAQATAAGARPLPAGGRAAPADTPSAAAATAGSQRWFALVAAAIVAALLGGVYLASSALNPLIYDRASIAQVAQATARGLNYANYDPNVDLRTLRAEQIKAMTATPDVVIFGGSRWQEAYSGLMPGKTVFDAYVSNDQAEDMLAIAYLLDRAGRLPKTMILSLRFVSLVPVAQRDASSGWDWQVWAPEYRAMAARLGVTPVSYLDSLAYRQWLGAFYVPALSDRVQQVATAPAAPHPTTAFQNPSLDVFGADGSLHWSKRSNAKFTQRYLDKNTRDQIAALGPTAPAIDPTLVAMMGRLIDWLQARGTRVIVAQTPYSPAFYAGIQGTPFIESLNGLEAVARQMQDQHGAIAAGGYDPARLGCPATAAHFLDYIHPRPPCMARVMKELSGVIDGARR